MREKFAEAGDTMRRGPGHDRDIPNVDPAVNDARRALKAAIADAVRGAHVDQRKLADILQRAADDIRGLATPHDDTHGVDL
jgi:hypothetical protein